MYKRQICVICQEKPYTSHFTLHFAQAYLHIYMNISNYMHIIAYIFPLMQNFFLRRDFCLAKQTAIRTDYITKQRHVKNRAERSFVMVSFISYKKIRRKQICACLCAMLFALTSFAATAQEYSWYFKPASGHAVPEVIPEAAGFIGKHAVCLLYTSFLAERRCRQHFVENRKTHFYIVQSIKQRFLILLHILVISKRKAFHHGKQRH